MLNIEIVIAFILVFMNGFFVAAEFGLVKIRPTYVEDLVRKGNRHAKTIKKLNKRIDAVLSATQIGITFVSLALGWIGEPAFAHLLKPLFNYLEMEGWITSSVTHTLSFIFAFSIISFLHIVVGEIAPKNLAITKTNWTAFFVAYPMLIIYYIFYPFLKVLNGSANLLLAIFGIKVRPEKKDKLSLDELRILMTSWVEGDEMSSDKTLLIENLFNFASKRVEQIMIPRNDIIFFSLQNSLEQNLEIAKKSNYTRFPLCSDDDLNKVIGIVHIKDVLWNCVNDENNVDISQLKREILFVPELQTVQELLNEFQRLKIQIAIVVDEHGSTTGLVTFEDILEEIVGEIHDEYDYDEIDKIVKIAEGQFEIDGLMPLDEFCRTLEINEIEPIATTIGGYFLNTIGRMAKIGDEIEIDKYRAIVTELEGFRISKLTVKSNK